MTRGNKLFVGSRMILPEHKERIREHRQEITKKTRPSLDEQRIEQYSQMISEAVENDVGVTITVFGPYREDSITGKIQKIDLELKRIRVLCDEDYTWIKFEDIINIDI
jgi:hypothetical protein